MSIAEKLTDIAENQRKVYDAGKQAEYDRFWYVVQDNGNRTDYGYAFAGSGWTDETFNPKYPIAPLNAFEVFRSTGITDFTRAGIVLDFSKCKDMRYAFVDLKNTEAKLPTIDLSNAPACYAAFNNYWGRELSLIVQEKTDCSTLIHGAIYLENLTISGTIGKNMNLKDSAVLSNESVQTIIDHLKDLTGATTQTLTLHADVGAKLTDAQKATITAKNWTLAY